MARTQNESSAMLEYGLDEFIVVIHVVLQVCILNKDNIAVTFFQPGTDGVAFAGSAFLQNQANAFSPADRLSRLARSVGRVAFYHDYFLLQTSDFFIPHCVKAFLKGGFLVVNRHYNT